MIHFTIGFGLFCFVYFAYTLLAKQELILNPCAKLNIYIHWILLQFYNFYAIIVTFFLSLSALFDMCDKLITSGTEWITLIIQTFSSCCIFTAIKIEPARRSVSALISIETKEYCGLQAIHADNYLQIRRYIACSWYFYFFPWRLRDYNDFIKIDS